MLKKSHNSGYICSFQILISKTLGKHFIVQGIYVSFKIQVDLYLGLQLHRDFNIGIQCYFCMNIEFHTILLTSSECFCVQVMGRTGGNKVTFFKGDSSLIGSFVDVKISEATAASLRGECEICQHSFGVTLNVVIVQFYLFT